MLECTTCIRQCIRTIFVDVLNTCPPSQFAISGLSARYASHARRSYATEAISFVNTPTPSPSLDTGISNPYVPQPRQSTDQVELYSKNKLLQELKWLKDPLKLGDHTVRLLQHDDYQKALATVRLASKDVECTVSWNHLIDHCMSQGRVTDAVKLYNEMKKRAQLPDAHTFTTLFRGFSRHPKFPLSISRALSIYHSMFADNSPVRPSIIHTNAVLKVCALAGDMDALLGVAAKLPQRGSGAPDNLSFTTILNAIRSEAWEFTKGEKMEPAKREKQARAVMQGRRLWEEIRDRWIEGNLYLDEELVCAMGRLMLLAGDEKNCDDILSLLEQTMGIPRQVPKLGASGRKSAVHSLQAIDVHEDADSPPLNEMVPALPNDSSQSEDTLGLKSDPFTILAKRPPRAHAAVQPGRNTLSLVLDACIRTRLLRAAQNYWGLLTDPSGPYKILPDTENYHMYLRLLRVQRASKLAVELIDDLRQGALGLRITLQTKTFRLGLSCCLRDKNNRNSTLYAAKLVRTMNDTLEHPDPRALSIYLRLGLSQQQRDWRTLMGMLRGTELGIRNLRSLLAYDPGQGKKYEEDIKELVKLSIGVIDVVLDIGNEEVTEEEKRSCKEQRYALAAWLTRLANKDRASKAEGERGQTYLNNRERSQAKDGADQIEGAHEDVNASRITPGLSPEQVADGKKRASRSQKNRRRIAEKDTATTWRRFVEDG